MSLFLIAMGFCHGMLGVNYRIEPMLWYGLALLVSAIFVCLESKVFRLIPAVISGVYCAMNLRWTAIYGTADYDYFVILAVISGLTCAFLLLSVVPTEKKTVRRYRRD